MVTEAKWWLDLGSPRQVIVFGLLLTLICAFFILKPAVTQPIEIVSIRKPIVMLDVKPDVTDIELGERYPVTFFYEKTRYDCENGRVVRHMYNLETGENYLVEDRPSVATSKPKPGEPNPPVKPFKANIPTTPLLEEDQHKMVPGQWKIDSVISYRCPLPSGGTSVRDEPYSTPIFTVKEKTP